MPRWDEESLERSIERLTAERDRYKAALEEIASKGEGGYPQDQGYCGQDPMERCDSPMIARKALGKSAEGRGSNDLR